MRGSISAIVLGVVSILIGKYVLRGHPLPAPKKIAHDPAPDIDAQEHGTHFDFERFPLHFGNTANARHSYPSYLPRSPKKALTAELIIDSRKPRRPKNT